MDTPRTDAAALGFARIMIEHGTPDNPKFETTEILPANFARNLERENERLAAALEACIDGWDDWQAKGKIEKAIDAGRQALATRKAGRD